MPAEYVMTTRQSATMDRPELGRMRLGYLADSQGWGRPGNVSGMVQELRDSRAGEHGVSFPPLSYCCEGENSTSSMAFSNSWRD